MLSDSNAIPDKYLERCFGWITSKFPLNPELPWCPVVISRDGSSHQCCACDTEEGAMSILQEHFLGRDVIMGFLINNQNGQDILIKGWINIWGIMSVYALRHMFNASNQTAVTQESKII